MCLCKGFWLSFEWCGNSARPNSSVVTWFSQWGWFSHRLRPRCATKSHCPELVPPAGSPPIGCGQGAPPNITAPSWFPRLVPPLAVAKVRRQISLPRAGSPSWFPHWFPHWFLPLVPTIGSPNFVSLNMLVPPWVPLTGFPIGSPNLVSLNLLVPPWVPPLFPKFCYAQPVGCQGFAQKSASKAASKSASKSASK